MVNKTHLRIIVIDDNRAIHNDIKKILRPSATGKGFFELKKLLFSTLINTHHIKHPIFHIDTAAQGQEGIELVKRAKDAEDPYALAFVDIRKPPGNNGIETIKQIWSLDKEIQIVICTARSDYSWEETIESLGMSDSLLILKKPFDNVAVRQLTCALTKKWQLMQDVKGHTDFLEQKVLERTESLQKSLSLTRAALESSYNGIIVVDNDHKIVDYNNHFVEMWNVPPKLMDSKNYFDIQTMMLNKQSNPEAFLNFIDHFKVAPDESTVIVLELIDGHSFECYSQQQKLNNRPVGRVWSFRDITQRVKLEEKLAYQATHDVLTSLPNRYLLLDRIQHGIAYAIRHNTMFSVMCIDLDRFKLINDSFSHDAGDKLLKILSKRLSEFTREEDTIARLSGDEFILISLTESISKAEDIMRIASKVLDLINKNIKINNRDISITASIGISIYPQDGKNPEELLRNADLAMYRAKSLGGNQIQFYTKQLNEKCLRRLEKESELRKAMIKNEFYLDYQPQYDMKMNKLVGVEALIRWKHPKYGVLLPIDFIPLAEDTSLIIPIGEWALKVACAQNKAWQDKGFPPLLMAVNVATKQFMQPNLVEVIKSVLNETGLKAEYLEIEVTENVIISNLNVINTIKELKKLGVRIVLDDFGTGNSGLNFIRHLPIDRLKIDKSFVHNINLNGLDEVIIKTIIGMAKGLSLDVVAEGVESMNQINFLETEHCDKFQGFYFSKPINAKQLEDLLENGVIGS